MGESNDPPPKREPQPTDKSRVIVLHCPLCGGFIAASSNPKIIEMAARLHRC